MFKSMNVAIITSLCVGLLACGGGGGDGSAGTEDNAASPSLVETGVFIDSAVGGLSYETPTQSGTTSASGEFSYAEGEEVVFSIGDIELPSVAAQEVITPLTVFNTISVTDTEVSNLSRLLQSLDLDGDPSNGIEISDAAVASATGVSIDFSDSDFSSNTSVTNLVANSGSLTTSLIDAAAAESHLQSSIDFDTQGGFSSDVLVDQGPWYQVTIRSDFWDKTGIDCNAKLSFYADGSAASIFRNETEQQFDATWVLDGGQVVISHGAGQDTWTLLQQSKSMLIVDQFMDSNDGSSTAAIFTDREQAVNFANSYGLSNCETMLPEV